MKNSIIYTVILWLVSGSAYAGEVPATNVSDPELLDVQNRCIIELSDEVGPSDVSGIANALAARGNASLKYVYKHSIKGFTINMPCHAAARAFGDDENVSSLTPDSIVTISKGKPANPGGGSDTPPAQKESWGTGRVGGSVDGTGYTAWIIDTGIDLGHPDLNVDYSRGFTAINSKGKPSMDDENGHGTHVAGTIGANNNTIGSLGVAPGTTVIPVRVLNRSGSGSTSGVIAGIEHVAAKAIPGDCANMSLGGGISQALDNAVIAAASASGAYFALAAGNEGDDANNHSPARADGVNVWTISAIDINDSMPSWSNYGSPVDYAAPGVGIFSLWKNGGTKTISGTSMAAPHACAVIMMTSGNPDFDGTAKNDPDGYPDPIIHF